MTRNPLLVIAAVAAFGWLSSGARVQAGGQAPAAGRDHAAPSEVSAPVVRAGSGDAARQLTLFCDVESERCARVVVVLTQVVATHAAQVGVRFRHVAPERLAQSPVAYRYVLAASRQGRGWDLLDMACANRDRLDDAGMRNMAAQLGLDVQRFSADAAAPDVVSALEDDAKDAKAAKVESGPALFLNGSRLEDAFTYDAILAALGLK